MRQETVTWSGCRSRESLGFLQGGGDKRHVRAAVAAEVALARLRVDAAEGAREHPRMRWVGKSGARLVPPSPPVRPAVDHAVVHAGHVALAAAPVLGARELGAAGAARLVRCSDGDPPQPRVPAHADVVVARSAIGCRGRGWLGRYWR